MKTFFCLLVSVGALPALDIQPRPALDVRGGADATCDLRLAAGIASPVTSASYGTGSMDAGADVGPHIGLEYVYASAGQVAFGLGVEAAYDEHRGTLESSGALNGTARLTGYTIGALPKLVLRPDFGDPFDAPIGAVQLELGPFFSAGIGQAKLGDSAWSNQATVISWGGRFELIVTTAERWQYGAQVGWQDVRASTTWSHASGESSGSGVTGGLLIGRRF